MRGIFRRILAAVFVLLLAGPAAASEPKKKEGAGAVGQHVDLAPVGLPIIVDGRLVNYVFVYVRINLTMGASAARWREKEPYFRDSLVRAAHRTPFTLPADLQKIDTDKLTAFVYRDVVAATGPGVVKSVVVNSQAPRWRARTPPPPPTRQQPPHS